ncbi:ribosomal protein S5 domain 2-type protein [Syncephalis fuscata]|nr:ribosomal protein S5 domain 2-type protein [Syncephalis fuscata]
MSAPCVVSAPGKVLITGGYLVLDPAYRGLVLGTDARFYAAIQATTEQNVTSSALQPINRLLRVKAPQFTDACWIYAIQWQSTSNTSWDLVDISEQHGYTAGKNPFVAAALRLTLAYAEHAIGTEQWLGRLPSSIIEIIMLGDNDFYSQRDQLATRHLSVSRDGLAALPRFCPTDRLLREVHKTGLGSSAALTTSLVAAVLAFLGVCEPDNEHGRNIIHNLAQACHCYAQGKIGSGFDVSSAVTAGHAYRRFSPNVLNAFLASDEQQQQASIFALVSSKQQQQWNSSVTPFRLPSSLILMMADVDAGSHTPSMVSKVLAWRKREPEQAAALWKELDRRNELVLSSLARLGELYTTNPVDYKQAISICQSLPADQWPTTSGLIAIDLLIEVHTTFQDIRRLLCDMGNAADVPIEPHDQTQLLDACLTVPGVLMAGVPGAGGNDAVFCIALGEESVCKVEHVWSTWTQARVTPLLCSEASGGIRRETWLDVINNDNKN